MEKTGFEKITDFKSKWDYRKTVIPQLAKQYLEEGWELYAERKRGSMREWNFRRPWET